MASRPYEWLPIQDTSLVMFERRRTHMHLAALALFETGPLATSQGGLDVERVRTYVESRLHRLPRYRQRLAFSPLQRHPIWVDDDRFNLRYHVRHTSLPQPGNEQKLKDLVGRIMSQQLDRAKPLWEMWAIEGLQSDRFALLAKIHHCMMDGISGTNVLTVLLDPSPEPSPSPHHRWVPRPAPTTLELLVDEGIRRARIPLTTLGAVRNALREPRRTLAEIAEGSASVWQALNTGLRAVASTPLNRPIGTHRRIDWQTLEVDEVSDLKKRLDGTFNDVVLAVAAGAVRRFLTKRRAQLKGLDYRVCIPVNMRSGFDDDRSANRVSAWFLSLPIAERNPLRRFEKIQRETRRLKRSKAARGTDLFTQFVDWTGSTWLTYAGVQLAARLQPYNLILSSVPGPQFPLYLLGAPMLALYPQLPLFENQGLGVAVMSYRDKVCWGLIGDWDLAPDLASFAQAIRASCDELRQAAQKNTT